MWRTVAVLVLVSLMLRITSQTDDFENNFPGKKEFLARLNQCRMNEGWCDEHVDSIIDHAIKITNDLAGLLMPDVAQSLFTDAYFHVHPNSTLGTKFNHIIGTLAFAQGDMRSAEKYWAGYNKTELVSARSLAAQVLIKGSEEKRGLRLMSDYVELISTKFQNLLGEAVVRVHEEDSSPLSLSFWTGMMRRMFDTRTEGVKPKFTIGPDARGEQVSERSDLILLELLLDEAQGTIRRNVKLNDMALHAPSLEQELSSAQRFRLAVGLAKLGHFDLSLRHVWLSATPWEAPLYLLRAKLVFAPVHKSVRALAIAVDNFETQGEQVLVMPPNDHQVPLMEQVCNSPNDAALALQSLPLLHLAGYSSPRQGYNMGHSPVALSVLLSEVYRAICPVRAVPEHITPMGLEEGFVERKRVQRETETGAAVQAEQGAEALSKKRKRRRRRRGTSDQGIIEVAADNEDENREERNGDAESGGTSTEKKSPVAEADEQSSSNPPRPPVKIGVVSGSFDGVPGKIVLGFVESIRRQVLHPLQVELTAMCFPTPRNGNTDRAGQVFDRHINLSPLNKTQAIERILDVAPDFIVYTDALLDSRVFALAHERLASWQGALWGYGGTFGVESIDYFFIPEPMWYYSRHLGCPMRMKKSHDVGELSLTNKKSGLRDGERSPEAPLEEKDLNSRAAQVARLRQQATAGASADDLSQLIHRGDSDPSVNAGTKPHPASSLFSEQVVYLRGLPPLPRVTAIRRVDLWDIMQRQYFIPLPSASPSNHLHALHLYLFPGSVRQMHPEFDQALYVLLKTDPAAMVLMAVPKTGRDHLPTVHSAVRHDLMHPAMPAAAAAKLRSRLRESLGTELSSRVRILPPLEERVYHSLRRHVVAVLDPFPVGTHVAILQAMKEGVPVVSAPILQECTHSHAVGIAKALRLSKFTWPTSAEEYAVEAMRLQREEGLRLEFVPPDSLRTSYIPRHRESRSGNIDNSTSGETEDMKQQFDMIEVVGDEPRELTHGEQLAQLVAGLVEGGSMERAFEA
jgi:hypothetical protein